jgi:hypothetical protein
MFRRSLVPAIGLTLAVATAAIATPALSTRFKWPPWISIESPVNPFDASARGAAFLVHAAVREGTPALTDVTGTAEGLVAGVRKSTPLRFTATNTPGVFAVRKQWPSEGTWLLRISLFSTTAIVSLDRGVVGEVRVPTAMASGMAIPRTVLAREIDSSLTSAARR